MTANDLGQIEAALKRGPEALGYSTGLWTLRRVVELIEKVCGIRYSTVHAWRILQQSRWSCQQPFRWNPKGARRDIYFAGSR